MSKQVNYLSKALIGLTMSCLSKSLSLLPVLLLVTASIALLNLTTSQTIPKPTVPQFNIVFYDSSYTIPASTATDVYNGQQIITPERHVEQKTIELQIKNVPFTPFQIKDTHNNTIEAGFFYNIRDKPHFSPEESWYNGNQYLIRSSGEYTIYRVNLTQHYDGSYEVPQWSRYVPADAQLDFQVQALIGGPDDPWAFVGQKSDWSNTQTINIQTDSTLPSPSQTVPEFSWLTILPLLLSIFTVAVLIRHRKYLK
ncbi:MAG: hypothetical protein ACQCN6_05385 [Candidatus Bathyarchaeia archaeon]